MITLKGFTIAVTNTATMVHFYNDLFDANLQPFAAFGAVLYRGELAGYALTFCPNTLLEINAEKNRQQLSFYVDDLTLFLQRAVGAGGAQLQDIVETKEGKSCGISDPDGNSIEVTQSQ